MHNFLRVTSLFVNQWVNQVNFPVTLYITIPWKINQGSGFLATFWYSGMQYFESFWGLCSLHSCTPSPPPGLCPEPAGGAYGAITFLYHSETGQQLFQRSWLTGLELFSASQSTKRRPRFPVNIEKSLIIRRYVLSSDTKKKENILQLVGLWCPDNGMRSQLSNHYDVINILNAF